MDFKWQEVGGYFVGFTGIVYDRLLWICPGLTDIFAMAIVLVTFFFITIPHAKEKREKRKEGKE